MSEAERERKKIYDSWIIEFAEKTPNCSYINLLDHEPFCDPSVFLDDGVHFNSKGYDLCEEFYKEVLKDELEKF
jgi:lysophospholipase L1-like esterase